MISEMRPYDDMFMTSAQYITNAVNCSGIMGGGLARAFKKHYAGTGYHDAYVEDCRSGRLVPGVVTLYKVTDEDMSKFFDFQGEIAAPFLPNVINFPTVGKLGEVCEVEWIREGLENLKEKILDNGIKSVAIPALGCGIVGHDWETVRKIIYDSMDAWSDRHLVRVFLYPPR